MKNIDLRTTNLPQFLLYELYPKKHILQCNVKETAGGYKLKLKYYLHDFCLFINPQGHIENIESNNDFLMSMFYLKQANKIKKQLRGEVSVALNKYIQLKNNEYDFLYH